MGNMDDQFNFMKDMAINDEQVKAINGAQNLVKIWLIMFLKRYTIILFLDLNLNRQNRLQAAPERLSADCYLPARQ